MMLANEVRPGRNQEISSSSGLSASVKGQDIVVDQCGEIYLKQARMIHNLRTLCCRSPPRAGSQSAIFLYSASTEKRDFASIVAIQVCRYSAKEPTELKRECLHSTM